MLRPLYLSRQFWFKPNRARGSCRLGCMDLVPHKPQVLSLSRSPVGPGGPPTLLTLLLILALLPWIDCTAGAKLGLWPRLLQPRPS